MKYGNSVNLISAINVPSAIESIDQWLTEQGCNPANAEYQFKRFWHSQWFDLDQQEYVSEPYVTQRVEMKKKRALVVIGICETKVDSKKTGC